MKYRVVFETTATHDIEVELDDDFFDDKDFIKVVSVGK